VVHPKYRTIGLGTKLVRDTLPLVDKPHVEMIAVMTKYNPFAEKAGMKKITIFKDLSKAAGIYRKRLWSSHKTYVTKEEFNNRVDKASLEKLAKTLRILGFLTQTKVYLFWKNINLSARRFCLSRRAHRSPLPQSLKAYQLHVKNMEEYEELKIPRRR